MEIELTQGKTALIDDEDWPLVSGHSWHAKRDDSGTYYAATKVRDPSAHNGQRSLMMHQIILPPQLGFLPDHVDGNGLDNRRANLRYATVGQNNGNRRSSGSGSNYKGVSFRRGRRKPWQAEITLNRRKRYLGCYLTEADAAKAYDEAALDQWGEFARLNFPVSSRPTVAEIGRDGLVNRQKTP